MRKAVVIVLFLQSIFLWAQITLPIQQSNIPKNNLVVNYDFSKTASFTRGSGTVTNLAGTASGNGTLYNAPIFMNSLGLISFNGSNQYVATPNIRTYFKSVNTSFQKSFTMSFWFYPIASTGVLVSELDSQTPSGGWHASNIEMVNGYLKYRIWNGSIVTSTSAVNLNQWYHVAMVYDGTSVKGYLNGVLQGTQAGAREIPTTSQHYAIGAGETTNMGTSAYGNFHLAQFKMFNLPFTDFDVVQEYESRKSEFDYTIHSPSTNSNPSYWSVSSVWAGETTFSQTHYTPWLNNTTLGWAAGVNDANQWINLNYDTPAYIKGVVFQPRANSENQFVTKVHVESSLTGAAPWTRVVSDVPVSTSVTEEAKVLFPTSIFTKYIKVIPVLWTNHITMRMGLLVKPNTSITNGLVLNLDAANLKSYSSGTTWTDLSGNGNNATLINGPTFNAGSGGQIVLDGVNDAVTTAAIPSTSGNNSRTVMAWYKSTANRNTAILDKGSVLDDGAEQLFVAYANSVGTTNAYPPTNPGGIVLAFWGNDLYYPIDSSLLFDGNWHFVAYTYDNTNSSVRICFDGSFATTVYQWNTSWTTNSSSPFVLPNSINTANNPVLIGEAGVGPHGDAQHAAHVGREQRVEQRGQVARNAQVGVVDAVDLARRDELAQAFVELAHDKAVEADGVVQQPMEGVDGHTCHHAAAQGHDVVAVGLALDGRALTKPTTGRHTRESDGAPAGAVRAHLQQAFHHAKPIRGLATHAAYVVARHGVTHHQLRFDAVALVFFEQTKPWNELELLLRERASSLENGGCLGHGF